MENTPRKKDTPVTPRKAHLKVDGESEQMFLQAVINNIPDIVWVKDVRGQYLLANKALERESGIAADLLINESPRVFRRAFYLSQTKTVDSCI